jgi:6,7-dimethyl-8-ribityllumazine synthase
MKILVIDARYHAAVADTLVDGATLALEKGGAHFARVSVPGVLELAPAIAIAARTDAAFDGYVALGCVLGGGTVEDTLYRETMRALAELGNKGLAIGNGVVLANEEFAAQDVAGAQDAGGDAGRACVALVTLRQRLGHML